MNRYLQTGDEHLCCGCRACEQACPTKAISMHPNAEGFLYPVLERNCCIVCGLCSRVCPMEHRPEGNGIVAAYAVQHRDEDILKQSSSGGVFRLLADHVIAEGGCVVGCKWDDHNRPVLAAAGQTDELAAMQGSKYLSSDTGVVYTQVKQRLDAGQKVLFTGAPCQCAGLLNYLKKPSENLITADFLCHGMPSQQIFDAYISSVEKRLGAKVYDIRFRDKSVRGWGKAFSCKYRRSGKEKQISNLELTDPYLFGFMNGYFNRYSCYECPFRGASRFTDITFCDYWGVETQHPEMDRSRGVSAAVMNTQKGEQLCRALSEKAEWIASEPQKVALQNQALLYPVCGKIPALRKQIYTMVQQDGWDAVAKKHLRTRHLLLKKLWYRVPRNLTGLIKRMLK